MPATTPMPTKNPGDVLTSTLWNTYLRDNLDKLLTRGHRVLTVAQFAALTGLEGTKGTVAPDEVYLEVDSANGIQWHLAYESGEPTYKWRFLGGPPMFSEVLTQEATASTAYVDLTTAGPSLALPRGGDFDIHYGYSAGAAAGGAALYGAFKRGAAATVDTDNISIISDSGSGFNPGARIRRLAGGAASDTIKLQYRVSSSTGNFLQRWIAITPVRII